MKSIFIFSDGELRRKGNTIYFDTKAGKKFVPVENVREILVFGEISLTKKILELFSQKEILVHFFNYYGYYTGSFYPREHYNSGYMLLKQCEFYLNRSKRFELAKRFVLGAYQNMCKVLQYYITRGIDLKFFLDNIDNLKTRIKDLETIDELRAIEGNMRHYYYCAFDKIIQDDKFKFDVRTKRPPKNRLNALISFGNSLLYITVLSEIYKTHLDPRIGFLHETNERRFTLNLDVAEVFKPIIVDRVIFTLLNKKMLDENDFDSELKGIYLKPKGRITFIKEFDKKLNTTIKHEKLKRNVSYRTLIRMELYKLEKHFMGDEEYIPFLAKQ